MILLPPDSSFLDLTVGCVAGASPAVERLSLPLTLTRRAALKIAIRARASTSPHTNYASLYFRFLLSANLVDHNRQVPRNSGGGDCQPLRRGVNQEHCLRQQLFSGGQVRQRLNLFDVDRAAFDDRPPEGKRRRLFGPFREQLRERHRIFSRKRYGRRSLELVLDLLDRCALGSSHCKRILNYAIIDIRASQLPPQPLVISDLEPLKPNQQRVGRRFKLAMKYFNFLFFLKFCLHSSTPTF